MSSSTAPDTSTALGQCVVCGKETSKGCGNCGRAGLGWMLFCSVDHQKLIWKTHKLVCGKNPFEWPPLSQEEVEEGWNSRNLTFAPDESETWMENRLKRMEEIGGEKLVVSDQLYKRLLDRLSLPDDSPVHQTMLKEHRVVAISAKVSSKNLKNDESQSSRILELIANNPVSFMAHSENKYGKELPEDAKYPSDLQHRLLIVYTLNSVMVQEFLKDRTTFSLERQSYIAHSLANVTFLAGGMSKSNPQGARRVIFDMVADAVRRTQSHIG